MNWDYFYLRNKKIVDAEGYKIFGDKEFENVEEAERYLEINDERGTVVGEWTETIKSIHRKNASTYYNS